jgi:hypothetical protein
VKKIGAVIALILIGLFFFFQGNGPDDFQNELDALAEALEQGDYRSAFWDDAIIDTLENLPGDITALRLQDLGEVERGRKILLHCEFLSDGDDVKEIILRLEKEGENLFFELFDASP